MPQERAVPPAARLYRAPLPALLAGAGLLAAMSGCAPADKIARKDLESLHTNVQQMESSLQTRQAGVYEQIRNLREEQTRLERLIEENGRQAKNIGQNVERLRERTQEELLARDKTRRESDQAAAEQLVSLGARIDAQQRDFQKNIQTLNDNLIAMSTFEKGQEERIVKIQEQFQAQLKVVVEEIGQENQALTASIAAVRADLDAARQDASKLRQGLAELQASMQQGSERLSIAVRQFQEAARRGSSAAPGRQHTVRGGETLSSIATRYGVSVQTLMEQNRISDPNSIREGQKLALPEP